MVYRRGQSLRCAKHCCSIELPVVYTKGVGRGSDHGPVQNAESQAGPDIFLTNDSCQRGGVVFS